MKKEYIIFACILAVLLILGIAGKSIILGAALDRLKGFFPGYEVKVGNAEIKSVDLVSFGNISIAKGDTNIYRVKELDIRFTPFTFFNRTIPKVSMDSCSIYIKSPKSKLKELVRFPEAKAGALFIVDSLEINDLVLDIRTADVDFDAIIRADASIKKDISYSAVMKLNSVNLGLLAKSLGASEKVDISGSMSGEISMSGKDMRIDAIKGEFASGELGGTIIIKDEEFINTLAKQSNQPVEMIRDSFKLYKYTKGTLSVSKEKDAILLHLMLDGPKGKRDMTIALHGS
ncbi:MAG: hypothetical protein PHR74_00040 [Candidatus Omnitrophica bacterium]|nr:hypothetical protein [Candidatus Omnitrophota bacterium]